MAKIHAIGHVDWGGTGNGILAVRIRDSHRSAVGKALTRLRKFEFKKKARQEIEFDLEVHYKKRTDAMNRLMWAMLAIVTNEHNSGGYEELRDSDYFYRLYLQRYAPREKAHTGEEMMKTSSKFTTVEMSAFIDRIFDEIAELDIEVTKSEEIELYWTQHREHMADKQVILRAETVYTSAEYRAAVRSCEACGRPVWHEDIGSSVAHVKAVGMGGQRHARYLGAELMHLCDVPCHRDYDNGRGREKFLKSHEHLRFKVESLLKIGGKNGGRVEADIDGGGTEEDEDSSLDLF